MPVLGGNQSTTLTPQQLSYQLKSNPDFYNILGGAAGYSAEPLLTICNEIMSRILAESCPWKWNRKYIPSFLTVSLQQDYCTQVTDIGWLEQGIRVDINNSTSNNNGAPKPIFGIETVRDISQTSMQSVPLQACFVPNSQAFMGQWQANTAYGCGYGAPMTPRTPIQQFVDINGNILYIDSTQLGLSIESPGYTNTTIIPSGAGIVYPYGTSGNTQPYAPPNSPPGTTVQDGTVIWTVADPNGYAIRLNPLPALNGLCWLINVWYQIQPPVIPTLTTPLNPIPNQYMYLFRQGVRAALYRENGDPRGNTQYAEWEEQLIRAVAGADRQDEAFVMAPTQSIMGSDGGPLVSPAGIGAAYPFSPGPFF